MKRREFLKASTMFTGALGLNYFAFPSFAQGAASSNKKLIFVFLRGAADVLSLFPPRPTGADANGRVNYIQHPLYSLRGDTKALAKAFLFNAKINDVPTVELVNGVLHDAFPGNGFSFNFHPGFANIKDIINGNNFSVILHTGSINSSRSHFDQMDFIESGSSTRKLNSGYLARAATLVKNVQARSSVAVGKMIPRSLLGFDAGLLSRKSDLGNSYNIGGIVNGGSMSRSDRLELFKAVSSNCEQSTTCKTVSTAQETYDQLSADFQTAAAETGSDFNQHCQVAAHLTNNNGNSNKTNPGVITIDFGGWDHHINERPTETGSVFSNKVADLANGLRTLNDNMSDDSMVVVMSEFGRTAVANTSFGTDHGRGSAMILMGKSIRKNTINTALPVHEKIWDLSSLDGVGPSRALQVKTDYRQIMAQVLKEHLMVNLTTNVSLQNQLFTIFDGLTESNLNRKLFG